jgi:hypothetical protein
MRRLFVLPVALVLAAAAVAQPPAAPPAAPRFKWEAGKVLTYRVIQQTLIRETTVDEKGEKPMTGESRTHLTLVRKWTVKDVDKAGVATLEMSISEMKNNIKQPDGSELTTDSSKPEDAKMMAAFLNQPIVTVRMDARGQLVEVKEAKGGAASRLHAELPFRVMLPEAAVAANASWERPFAVKLDPPHGTGENRDFVQKYTSKGEKDGLFIVGVETSLKAVPKSAAEQVPLAPMLWTGDVYFNVAAGKYHAARLRARADLANHQGEGTKFVYESSYAEDCIDK